MRPLAEEHKDAPDPIAEAVNAGDGVEALRAWAQRLAQTRGLRRFRWPHLLILMVDQIYADDLSAAMKQRIKPSRKRLRNQLQQQGITLDPRTSSRTWPASC